jgi:hypothetical protein
MIWGYIGPKMSRLGIKGLAGEDGDFWGEAPIGPHKTKQKLLSS